LAFSIGCRVGEVLHPVDDGKFFFKEGGQIKGGGDFLGGVVVGEKIPQKQNGFIHIFLERYLGKEVFEKPQEVTQKIPQGATGLKSRR
jgi:hypothetical protein